MSAFLNYRERVGSRAEKFYKDTLFKGEHLMVGINCLEPGQIQTVHDHAGADKMYVVLEGSGQFTVGQDSHAARSGDVVWAPAGVPHGVENNGKDRLVLLVGIGPPPA